MNYRNALLLFVLSVAGISAKTQNYKTAIGLRLSNGEPILHTGLSVKHFVSEDAAIEGIINLGSPYGMGAMYLLHKPLPADGLRWFYGGGGYFGFPLKTFHVGGTAAVGLDYAFSNAPINISLDWKPELNIAPDLFFEPAAFGFSIRYTLPRKLQ